jgi:Fe-S-cluster-containing hydrogenase component 2
MLYVDENRCSGCGVCIEVCSAGAISLRSGVAVIDQERCTQCEACFEACPEQAILSVSDRSLVAERDRAAAVATSAPPRASSIAARAAPALAATLLFIGREVVPRAASFLLDIVDRRLADQGAAAEQSRPQPSGQSRGTGSAGRRHRRRRGL